MWCSRCQFLCQYRNSEIGSRVIVRTHLRKSATPLRSPQRMGTPTKYRSQLAMKTETDTSTATIGSPAPTDTRMTAA